MNEKLIFLMESQKVELEKTTLVGPKQTESKAQGT